MPVTAATHGTSKLPKSTSRAVANTYKVRKYGGFVMKRLFLIGGLATAFLLLVLAASAQNKTNFGGTWSLDKAKSQGLSPRMEGADKVTWTITQDDKTILIDSKVEGGQAAGGGGGGRPPMAP